ncbi:MAG: hypothetical protein M1833_004566 [Piccolia ochrophora]|nr:MAG: hypothetical protein M1833_004566 [Piccolia ochrophora]
MSARSLQRSLVLSDATNSPTRSRSPSPPYSTAKTSQLRHLRRRESFRALNPHVDSSEECFSEHSSVFDANFWSPSETSLGGKNVKRSDAELDTKARENSAVEEVALGPPVVEPEVLQTPKPHSPPRPQSGDRRQAQVTPLATITEQRSFTTLRDASRKLSFNGQLTPAGQPVNHEEKADNSSPQPTRKQSRSLGSLNLGSTPAHVEGRINSSVESTGIAAPIPIYAEPVAPLMTPPERAPTPPGAPSWSAPGHNQRRLASTGYLGTSTLSSGRVSQPHSQFPRIGLPPGVVSLTRQAALQGRNDPSAAVQPPRYRPVRSGHGSHRPLSSHPFHRLPLAKDIGDGASDQRHASQQGHFRRQSLWVPDHSRPNASARPVSIRASSYTRSQHAGHAVIGCTHHRKKVMQPASLEYDSPTTGPGLAQRMFGERRPREKKGPCWKCRLRKTWEDICILCCVDADDSMSRSPRPVWYR